MDSFLIKGYFFIGWWWVNPYFDFLVIWFSSLFSKGMDFEKDESKSEYESELIKTNLSSNYLWLFSLLSLILEIDE